MLVNSKASFGRVAVFSEYRCIMRLVQFLGALKPVTYKIGKDHIAYKISHKVRL